MTDSVRVNRPVRAVMAAPASGPPVRLLAWLAGTGIGRAILLMIGAALVRQDWMYPAVPTPAPRPPRGHTPYVASPVYLRLTEPAFGASVPVPWDQQVSLYGPAATIEQVLAAKLGGSSMARVVLWLKLGNALASGAVAIIIDRVLRSNP